MRSTTVTKSHARSGSSTSLNQSRPSSGLLGIDFNQDASCFSAGLETGFRLYSSEPLRELLRRDYEDGGIGQVAMLFRSNFLAIVGGGKNPRYPPNKVIIMDEKSGKAIAELEFRSDVKAVRLRKDRIIAVLRNKVHIYSLERIPRRLQTFETAENSKGLCALCLDSEHAIAAFPSLQMGHVQIAEVGEDGKFGAIIPAHSSPIACIALDRTGRRLATASEKGTLVRVFDVKTGRLLHELRRGADKAEIYSIAFNADSSRVCVSSDKGTIHIFNLNSQVEDQRDPIRLVGGVAIAEEEAIANRQSSLSFMKEILPKYFSSQWSFAQCRVTEVRCLATFGSDPTTILVIAVDGSFFKYSFDPVRGGECTREYYSKFLNLGDAD